MNFKISKKEFLDALNLSNRAISSTTPLPSLSGIKITVTPDSLILVSSDSNISIRTSLTNNEDNTLTINEEGEIVIDAKYILEIVRKIDSDFVLVETIDGTLIKISGGNSEFKINGINSNEYPQINFDIRDNSPFKIETEIFNQIINQTAFACSDKETRPILTGVNLKSENNKLSVSATDSYRLATKTIDINSLSQFNIAVPCKYLTEVSHAIVNEKEVTIAIDKQKISFIFGNTIIDTRLLDDEFPDTSRLIPNDFTQILNINSKSLLNAIDRTSFIKSDGKNIVKLKINSESVELTSSNQIGNSYEKIDVINFEGSPLEISCSGKYLQDAIKAIDEEDITIKFSGELKPLIIENSNKNSLIQLISPVRTYN